MRLEIGMQVPSCANLSEHWRAKARRVKAQRQVTSVAFRDFAVRQQVLALVAHLTRGGLLTVTLTRVSPRALDSDNLASSMKGPRDQIAEELGVDDGPKGPVTWLYSQATPTRLTRAGFVVEISERSQLAAEAVS